MQPRIYLYFLMLFTTIPGCKTYSYFASSNDLVNQECKMVMVDGSEMFGKLTVQFEEGHNVDKQAKFLTKEHLEKRIPITDIKYYLLNNEYYFPKEINLEPYQYISKDKLEIINQNNLLFVKRLTKENANIELYVLNQPRNRTMDGVTQDDYFVSFKTDGRFGAWNIRSDLFFPNFEEKASKMVSDCPLLYSKIKAKEKGYTVKQISIDASKRDVIRRIITEYNNCR